MIIAKERMEKPFRSGAVSPKRERRRSAQEPESSVDNPCDMPCEASVDSDRRRTSGLPHFWCVGCRTFHLGFWLPSLFFFFRQRCRARAKLTWPITWQRVFSEYLSAALFFLFSFLCGTSGTILVLVPNNAVM